MWRSLCSVDTCTIIYGVSIYSAKSAESKKTTNDHTYTHYVELGNKKHTSCSISEIATKTALILMQASGTLPSEKELSCRLLWCIFLIDPTFSRWEGALTMKNFKERRRESDTIIAAQYTRRTMPSTKQKHYHFQHRGVRSKSCVGQKMVIRVCINILQVRAL